MGVCRAFVSWEKVEIEIEREERPAQIGITTVTFVRWEKVEIKRDIHKQVFQQQHE